MGANPKVYIHELIDIIGHNRAKYFHHMTANWCPIGRAERNMACFGVWGTVGSTGRWPEVVNMWELDGWDGLAANLAHELANPSLQDPSLAEWWAVAAELRRGGVDRILVPEPWSPTIDELTSAGVRGVVYAHELVRVGPGQVRELLDAAHAHARDAVPALGGIAIGAFRVALRNDDEALLLWAFPEWEAWVRYERAWDARALGEWRTALLDAGAHVTRTLLADAPLAPLRIGRQPEVADRRPLSEIP
ncbi:MAG TPA: NIPSNAP family containing protein [Acidimicrobiia bacterium]|nr:NIPSNAP family containing protein [Acidimicrobiia bacterium]